ncbi:hypothetical protein C8238_00500 [Paracidovorax avenae]|nr:hypothetical protein C8238_00500 [Paracidovorax avenae]
MARFRGHIISAGRSDATSTKPSRSSKRWIVERRFAWLEKNWRLWKNCERWLDTRLQFVYLVCRPASWLCGPEDRKHALR